MNSEIKIYQVAEDELPELINWFTDNYYHSRELAENHFVDHYGNNGYTFLAKDGDIIVGYVSIGIAYTKKIPLIQDFYVADEYRRKGIGTRLMDTAENYIAGNMGNKVVLWVPVHEGFGPAQIMYIKRGYLPDGRGIVTDNIPVKSGETVTISDEFHWCLEKELG